MSSLANAHAAGADVTEDAGACYHCGLPNPTGRLVGRYTAEVLGAGRAFCCPGCQAVAESIVDSGLEGYYRERDSSGRTASPPAPADVLARFDHPAAQQEFVRREGRHACVELSLESVSCAACAWLIERRLGQDDAVAQASVNLSNHRLRLVWDSERRPLSSLLAALEAIGYRARPFRADTHAAQLAGEARTQVIRVAVAGLGAMQAMMYGMGLYIGAFQGIDAEYRDYLRWISGLVTTPVFLYAGWPFYRSAWRALRARTLNMDVPVSIALIGTFLASWYATLIQGGETYFDSVCMFIFFLLTSRYLELKARQRAGETAASQLLLAPRLAHRLLPDGSHETVSADALRVGDRIMVAAGESVPCDARVTAGRGSVSEALLTGEPLPRPKHAGDDLIGGSINGDQPLHAEVTRTGGDTVLATLHQLLARALSEKPLIAQRADRIAHFFVARVLVLAVLVYIGWQFVDPSQAFWATLAVLVATCPCALSVATPAALTTATHTLAREGFLLTRGHVLDSLAQATHVVFDKTGTLTLGQLTLRELDILRGDRAQALALIAGLETGSSHPIARAMQALAGREDIAPAAFDDTPVLQPGDGVSARLDGRAYRFGHAGFALGDTGPHTGANHARASHAGAGEGEAGGHAGNPDGEQWLTLWLCDADGPLARAVFEDQLRPEALPVVQELRARGLKTLLMSGDRSSVPAQVAATLALDGWQAGMTPADKQQAIAALQDQGAVVVMVGDGVNDAPGLGQAHLGIAMGSGTDLAQTSADVVLLGDRLPALLPAFRVAARTAAIVRQNLRWALGYNLAILPPAALGFVPPWLAALGMSLSSLVVVLNALRLRRAE